MEIIPCSRIGHVFRTSLPYISGHKARDVVKRNLLRVAQIWMDEYKFYYHQSINHKLVITCIFGPGMDILKFVANITQLRY